MLPEIKKPPWGGFPELAEAVRFELTVGYKPTAVFKTAAINRSATLPFFCRGWLKPIGQLSKARMVTDLNAL